MEISNTGLELIVELLCPGSTIGNSVNARCQRYDALILESKSQEVWRGVLVLVTVVTA